MISYITHLKKTKMHHSNRWIVKYNEEKLITEVKLIYAPDEYRKFKNSKPLNNYVKRFKDKGVLTKNNSVYSLNNFLNPDTTSVEVKINKL